jgi:hypothetical protein
MTFEIKNRVSESKLITIDFNDFIVDFSFENFDIKQWLKDDLILIEKDFRVKVKGFDWTSLKGKKNINYLFKFSHYS